jgi:hypothetical protein
LTDDPQVHETDQAILSALTIQPFGLVRDIAGLTCLSCFTVHSHLTHSLGFRVHHLRVLVGFHMFWQMSKSSIESETRKRYWRCFKHSRSAHGMTVRRSTSHGFISALNMNEYGLLPEKPRLIESVTRCNSRNSCWLSFGALLGFTSSSCSQKVAPWTPATTLMKSYPRLPVRAKQRAEARIENWLSMPITLPLILPAGQCDIFRLAGWFEFLILHAHQIKHHQTFSYSVISKTCSRDDISRLGNSFEPRYWTCWILFKKWLWRRYFSSG